MDYFQDKVALVTGASRGVGFATAKRLLQRGARVVITARGEERLADSKEKLSALGEVASIAGDVGDWDQARSMVSAAIENFGRLDILVNNAGVSMRGKFNEISEEVCTRVARTNLMGCIYMSKAAIPHLVEEKGHLVFISSIAGLFGLPGASIYCATKKALTGLAESMRTELFREKVHVGVVYLGFTEHDPEKRILAADGSLVLPDRPAHHTQDHAASLIIKMLEKRKKQLIMTPAGVAGSIFYRISPALLEKAIIGAQKSQMGIFKRFS